MERRTTNPAPVDLAILLIVASAATLCAAAPPEILWWRDLAAPSFGSAATADIDGDQRLEIVFGTYFNDEHVYALNAEDGSLLWSYDTGGCNDASPAIADVDLDGALEVILPASSPCKVFCFDGATGAVEWSTSTSPNSIDSPPAIADVDHDLRPEIIFGAFYGHVYCLNGEDGSESWHINLGSDSYIQSEPNVVDLDADGQLDIVVAQWRGTTSIYALRGNDGGIKWFSDLPSDNMYHGGSFADLDGDGLPEIVIGAYDRNVYALNGEDGTLAWSYRAPYYVGAPTSIADLDHDGRFEIVFAAHTRIGALAHDGQLEWGSFGGSSFRGAALADIDGDGYVDLCFGGTDGNLRAWRGRDGQELWTLSLQQHYGRTFQLDHAPVIADFDGDGDLDVFAVGGYGVYPPENNHGRAYAVTGGAGTGGGWPMFRHDLAHSGTFGPVTIAGDLNCDGSVDFGDINPFVLALTNRPAYAAAFPYCSFLSGDVNGDDVLDFGDIKPFVDLLSGR